LLLNCNSPLYSRYNSFVRYMIRNFFPPVSSSFHFCFPFVLFCWLIGFWDRVLLCSQGWLWTHDSPSFWLYLLSAGIIMVGLSVA
jgi:hypothetical protein